MEEAQLYQVEPILADQVECAPLPVILVLDPEGPACCHHFIQAQSQSGQVRYLHILGAAVPV